MGVAGEVRGRGKLQAVIVAGGVGSRLGALTAETPKPLLDVGGRPFVQHLLFELERSGVDEAVLLVGSYRDAFRRALEPGSRRSLKLVLVPELAAAGTAGAVWHARKHLAKRFLLLNGDSILDGNLLRLVAGVGKSAKQIGAVAVLDVPDTLRYGRVECAGDRVVTFREKGQSGRGPINAGVYLFERDPLLARIGKPPCSLEREVLPNLAAVGALRAVRDQGRFIDIGLPESLAEARGLFPAWHRRPAAVIELSALARLSSGRAARIGWRKGAAEALRRFNDAGYYTIVLAPGVAGGAGLRRRLNAAVLTKAAHIDALYAARSSAAFDALLDAARAEWPIAESGSMLVTGAPHIVPQTPPYLAVFRAPRTSNLDELIAAALEAS
jgi:D-glycero-D-manno-heptose 1,7-bisphosphate phosphatase